MSCLEGGVKRAGNGIREVHQASRSRWGPEKQLLELRFDPWSSKVDNPAVDACALILDLTSWCSRDYALSSALGQRSSSSTYDAEPSRASSVGPQLASCSCRTTTPHFGRQFNSRKERKKFSWMLDSAGQEDRDQVANCTCDHWDQCPITTIIHFPPTNNLLPTLIGALPFLPRLPAPHDENERSIHEGRKNGNRGTRTGVLNAWILILGDFVDNARTMEFAFFSLRAMC